jgi:hypothetical protein
MIQPQVADSENAGGSMGMFETKYIAMADAATRQGFVKKVYGIVALQVLLTTVIATPFMLVDRSWTDAHQGLLLLSSVATLAIVCAAACKPDLLRKYPQNYAFLFTFTFFEAVVVGFIISAYDGASVLLAFGLTIAITGALTVYAMTTETDFTGMGHYLMAALFALVLVGFVMMFVPGVGFGQKIMAGCGALLFSCYLVYDTQLIMGGNHKLRFEVDDYCWAALNIYLDILNLFLYILELMGDKR